MNATETHDDYVVRWTFKGIVLVLFIGLGIGFLVGYGVRAIQSRVQESQLTSLAQGTVNTIGFELEEYKEIHGAYPDSLTVINFEEMDFSPTERALASNVFYQSSGESYELILGIPSATWIDEGRIVRYRRTNRSRQ